MFRRSSLLFREGSYSEDTNRPNVLSRIYSVAVPKGNVWELDPTRPFLCYLLCKDLDLTPSTQAAGHVTASHGITIPVMASGAAAPPGRYEVLVGEVTAGTKVRLTIDARDATTISFTETLAAGTKVDAFYIASAPARLQFRIEDPREGVTVDRIIFTQDPNLFMLNNPFHANTLFGLAGPTVFPEDFLFSLWLDAPYEVAWEDTTASKTALPMKMVLPLIINTRPVEANQLASDLPGELIRA